MGEHTSPKPWAIRDLAVVDRDGRIVCEPTRGPDAEDIVRACNAHDDLLEACEAMLALVKVCSRHYRSHDEHDAMKQAATAIAKAKEPQE